MAFRSVTVISTPDGGSGHTITKPAGTVDGDILIFAAVTDGTGGTLGVPSGFSSTFGSADLSNITSTADGQTLTIGWKIAASEGASYSYLAAGARSTIVFMAAYSGRDGTSTINAALATSNNSSNASPWSINLSQITTNVDGCDLLAIATSDVGTSAAALAYTPPGGWTERVDAGEPTTQYRNFTLADFNQTSQGATGIITIVGTCAGVNAGWSGALIALAPSGGGGSSPVGPSTLLATVTRRLGA